MTERETERESERECAVRKRDDDELSSRRRSELICCGSSPRHGLGKMYKCKRVGIESDYESAVV